MVEAQLAVFVASGIRLAMPIILAGTGELVSQRAGVLNLSLDGMMLVAAFAAAWGAWVTGSPVLGVVAGVVASLLVAWVQAFLSVTLRANQLVVGIGFNILALGATTFLYREIFGPLSRQPIPGFEKWHIPGLESLPIIGPGVFQQTGLVYLGLFLVLVTWALLKGTSLGLSIRAVGEDPRAADKAGIHVKRVRYLGVLFAGAMAGLGGAFMSVADSNTFTEGMTRGAGYLAITAVIFGGWTPGRTLAACLLFGFATALQFLVPALGLDVPVAWLLMLPYVLALCAIAGFVGKQRQPSALTLPFVRGR
ncbi:ABC transporter permease [Pandoraea terrae]|uniref:ABC transporter permease n=1 Tax=Pandoraea terrae TaxID=1537710 RepID=A0A5E4T164_9BURK|nr:ABC transporter permease [Pandoraea terrae]VVD81525.1 ABC transporter permease [Pandoraea terrae]